MRIEKYLREVEVEPAEVVEERDVVAHVQGMEVVGYIYIDVRYERPVASDVYFVTHVFVRGPKSLEMKFQDVACRYSGPLHMARAVACKSGDAVAYLERLGYSDYLLLYNNPAVALTAFGMLYSRWPYSTTLWYREVMGCVDFDSVRHRPGTCLRGLRGPDYIVIIPYAEAL